MKEKKHKSGKHKKKKKEHKSKRRHSTSSSNSSSSDKWVEQKQIEKPQRHEDWMSMTGLIPTFSKKDIATSKPKEDKKQIDSYDPSTSVRELNPYWKDGGAGIPMVQSHRHQKPPQKEDRYENKKFLKPKEYNNYYERRNVDRSEFPAQESRGNWRKKTNTVTEGSKMYKADEITFNEDKSFKKDDIVNTPIEVKSDKNYLTDEEMNKLGAKIIKAEILGNEELASRLKAKLEAAREYKKSNPKPPEVEAVMLMSTSASGSSRPLTKSRDSGDQRSKGGKRKAETHKDGERTKYFANDDRTSLADMFEKEKYGSNYDDDAQLARVTSRHKNPNDDLEDIFSEEISKNVSRSKEDERERDRAINQHKKLERSLEGCNLCVESQNALRHLMVGCGDKTYVTLPTRVSLTDGHCYITTIHHSTCSTALDEDVWEEIMNFRRCLVKMFDSQNKDVIFFETAKRLDKYPHMKINCVPYPRDVGDAAPIYFKKALLECEAEWSMNKKIVDLEGKSLRRCVPKGLPYFWVDFGMIAGYAHVIEDQQLFPDNFAEEIIGGILDLDHQLWKRPSKEPADRQRKKAIDFISVWKNFDTVSVK